MSSAEEIVKVKRSSFAIYCVILLQGFASGLPLALTGQTLQAWMADENVALKTIGIFALVRLPYTFKFVWSPLLDRYYVRALGRRRTHLLLSQAVLVILTLIMAGLHPQSNAVAFAWLALLISFFSANQDIVVDAYRREILTEPELGLGSSLYVTGYRIAFSFIGISLALILAGKFSWQVSYEVMAGFLALCLLGTLISPEPKLTQATPSTLKTAVVEPFKEFFGRGRVTAVYILLFVVLYKVGDQFAAVMLMPFYKASGFTLAQIGAIGKITGLIGTIAGGFVGGVLLMRIGLLRSLWIFGILQATSNGIFALLLSHNGDISWLAFVILVETFCAGMGTAAFIAFLAGQTNRAYTATQYALLSSVMGIPQALFSSASGYYAEILGWEPFFYFCIVLSIPGLLLLILLRERNLFKVIEVSGT